MTTRQRVWAPGHTAPAAATDGVTRQAQKPAVSLGTIFPWATRRVWLLLVRMRARLLAAKIRALRLAG